MLQKYHRMMLTAEEAFEGQCESTEEGVLVQKFFEDKHFSVENVEFHRFCKKMPNFFMDRRCSYPMPNSLRIKGKHNPNAHDDYIGCYQEMLGSQFQKLVRGQLSGTLVPVRRQLILVTTARQKRGELWDTITAAVVSGVLVVGQIVGTYLGSFWNFEMLDM